MSEPFKGGQPDEGPGHMNIHEYQAKKLFKEAGVAVLDGLHCRDVEGAVAAYRKLGSGVVAVKSQIHAGGRGKGTLVDPVTREKIMDGGVKIALNEDDVRNFATNILGNVIVTNQTGDDGKLVNNLYVEAGCDIAHEYYLAVLVDRDSNSLLVMASREGGVDIEEVAESSPDSIHRMISRGMSGFDAFQCADLGRKLGLSGTPLDKFSEMVSNLGSLFIQSDCSMIEINPLVETTGGDIVALDAKVSFDENASFRHPEWEGLRDYDEEEEIEVRAKKTGLSYVKLDGNIGCMVNGAGLAMATMDVIKLYGGEPANFLDVGGGANEDQVTTAFSIILEDQNVDGILVNIFGGIMRCDIIANGIISAVSKLGLERPLVVRLAGTNVEEGRAILSESELNIYPADSLADGAEKIVKLVKEAK